MRIEQITTAEARAGNARRVISGPTMGTRYALTCYPGASVDLDALAADLAAAVGRVDAQMSTWKPGSDLMRLNAAPIDTWIELPAELMVVLSAALRIGRLTDGAFDVAVGDLVAAWGFGAGPRSDRAHRHTLAARSAPPAHEALELDPGAGRARKLAPLALDLSGIAKGYGVDELARVASRFGLGSHLAAIDGELRGTGRRPDGSPWIVAIETPQPGRREADGIVALADASLATSGDYRHFAEIDGRIVSHTMDPQTRLPLSNGVAAVTVQASTCMEADGWATAMMVLGPARGPVLAARNGIEALFVTRG